MTRADTLREAIAVIEARLAATEAAREAAEQGRSDALERATGLDELLADAEHRLAEAETGRRTAQERLDAMDRAGGRAAGQGCAATRQGRAAGGVAMLGLTTAFFTAALALFGNIVLSFWRQDQDRRTVAAALAGEISGFVGQYNAAALASLLRRVAAIERDRRPAMLRWIFLPADSHPVFDKLADKIGLLPVDEAEDVARLYSFITRLHAEISNLMSDEVVALEDESSAFSLNGLATQAEQTFRDTQDLVERLKRIARRGWRTRPREALRRLRDALRGV